ncbi:hypothetical protein CK203_055146 [Vitis vinifera]|uniref:Uncharacterized protein n=1 Tax=Vitis vinifera TaxID=29760 RepID=A0A438GMY3_VITVI|nr:hypothetical protein CK203_055146 [Vitis vinifera]
MPMNPILIVELFDVWGIDFMDLSNVFWVVLKFLKEKFSQDWGAKAIISGWSCKTEDEEVALINSSPTRNFRKGKEFYCMTQDSISFLGSSSQGGLGLFIIHRVYSNGVVELLNSNGKDSFRVNGYRLKPFMEPFKPKKEEINLLEPQKLKQRRHRSLHFAAAKRLRSGKAHISQQKSHSAEYFEIAKAILAHDSTHGSFTRMGFHFTNDINSKMNWLPFHFKDSYALALMQIGNLRIGSSRWVATMVMLASRTGEEWKFIQKYLKKNIQKCQSQLSGSFQENTRALFKMAAKFSQQKANFAAMQKSSFSLE